MSKSIVFFAANEDLKAVAAAVEAERQLRYVLAGLFDTPDVSLAGSVEDIDSFGVAQKGEQAQELSYLATPEAQRVNVREVAQRRGGVKYAVDQLQNPGTVVITPGGRFGDLAVISGQIGTAAADPSSQELFKAFEREIKRRFLKVKSYYVGPTAKELMDSGARLTTNVRSPAEYDLK